MRRVMNCWDYVPCCCSRSLSVGRGAERGVGTGAVISRCCTHYAHVVRLFPPFCVVAGLIPIVLSFLSIGCCGCWTASSARLCCRSTKPAEVIRLLLCGLATLFIGLAKQYAAQVETSERTRNASVKEM